MPQGHAWRKAWHPARGSTTYAAWQQLEAPKQQMLWQAIGVVRHCAWREQLTHTHNCVVSKGALLWCPGPPLGPVATCRGNTASHR